MAGITDAAHLCIDMQNIFAKGGVWETPWMERVLPVIADICARYTERTVFTRFVTPRRAEDMPGMWQIYYRRWAETTRERLDPALLALMPPLAALVPPASVFDKRVYSAFAGRRLRAHLAARGADTLIISGAETDVCVAATALAAIDLGFRVIIVTDAVCSSSDQGHDSLLTLFEQRFTIQLQTADTESILSAWPKG